MTTRTIVTTLVGLALIAALGFLAVYLLRDATVPYTNTEHGFTLAIPDELDIREYTPEIAAFGHVDGEMIDIVAESRVMVIEGDAGETFEEAAAPYIMNLCAADGPTASFSCVGIERVETITTDSGLQGIGFYFTGELRSIPSGEVSEDERGPFYAFVLETGARVSKLLIIHAPLAVSAENADASTIRAIAESYAKTQ